MYDQSNNFFAHICDQIGQRIYLAACRKRMAMIDQGSTMYPECVAAIAKGLCPAAVKNAEERAAFRVIYYHDRDDKGPGVMSRRDLGLPERTFDEIEAHRALLDKLKIKAEEKTRTEAFRYDGPAREGVVKRGRKPTTMKLDNGSTIAFAETKGESFVSHENPIIIGKDGKPKIVGEPPKASMNFADLINAEIAKKGAA